MSAATSSADTQRQQLLAALPRLMRHAELLSGPSGPVTGIVENAIRHARQQGIADMAGLLSLVRVEATRLGPPADHPVSEPSGDPLLRVIHSMPADQRQALLLVCAEGLGYREAAAVTGLSMAAFVENLLQSRRQVARAEALDGGATEHADDTTFMAFADGELNERVRQGVERALDANADFVERTGLFIRGAALSRQALDTVLERQVPAHLIRDIETIIARTRPGRRGWRTALRGIFGKR